MSIISQSEWMVDQRQAQVMGPNAQFSVIQTSTGSSILFSIGSDNHFYASREVQTTGTGWTKVDLGQNLPVQSPVVKSFVVAQDSTTLAFNIALVVTVGAANQLFLSLDNANTDDAWSSGVQWTSVPFDDGAAAVNAASLVINGVYMMALPSSGSSANGLTCFVDILQSPKGSDPLNLLARYYIEPTPTPSWNKHLLPLDLRAGNISCCLGRRTGDRVGGIYTFGKITGETELIFVPAYNAFVPSVVPSPARLSLPDKTTSMASSLNTSGTSNLFVSASQGIFYFPPDGQHDQALGKQIISSALVSSATHLTAETAGGITALYGQTSQGDLFYTTCQAGSEALSSAWSTPMPIASQIEAFSFFVNQTTGNNILFTYTTGNNVSQLIQDPVTAVWASRNILLPSTDITDIVTLQAFTTRVICQDAQGAPIANASVTLKSTSPVGVYVNDLYHTLDPITGFTAMTDLSGILTIVQPIQDMNAICYTAGLVGQQAAPITIDPGVTVKGRLAAIQSGSDLQNAQVMQSDGTTRPLINSSISQSDLDTGAAAIQHLVQVSNSLPSNGAPISDNANAVPPAAPVLTTLVTTAPSSSSSAVVSFGTAIESDAGSLLVKAGDLFQSMLHTAWESVKDFTISVIDGVHQVLVNLGNAIYRSVLDSVAAVTHAIQWVLTKLQVAWDDIKAYLGFVFDWNDIIRTHKVIRNVASHYSNYSVSRIAAIQEYITNNIDSAEQELSAWGDIPDEASSAGQLSGTSNKIDLPQIHYIEDKVKAYIGSASTSAASAIDEYSGDLNDALALLSDQKAAFSQAFDEIKAQIIGQFTSLTPAEAAKRLLAIIGDTVLTVANNLVVKTLGLVQDLTTAVIEELSKPITIPVLSPLYQKIADEELSILDLICLLAAVPATILYKVVTDSSPFPDNAVTDSIIQAPDFPSIQTLMSGNPSIYKTLSIVSEFAAMAGLGGRCLLNTIEIPWMKESKPEEVKDVLKQISIPMKFLVLMPKIITPRPDNGPWQDQMDAAITDMAFLKTCLDATSIGDKSGYGEVSPWIDYAISAVWVVPSVGIIVANHSEPSSYMSLATSLAYDVSVMTGPIVWNPDLDAESKLEVLAAANGLIMVAAAIRVATGGSLGDGK